MFKMVSVVYFKKFTPFSQKPHNFMKFGQLDFVQILQDCSTNTNYGIGNNIVKIYCVDVE